MNGLVPCLFHEADSFFPLSCTWLSFFLPLLWFSVSEPVRLGFFSISLTRSANWILTFLIFDSPYLFMPLPWGWVAEVGQTAVTNENVGLLEGVGSKAL